MFLVCDPYTHSLELWMRTLCVWIACLFVLGVAAPASAVEPTCTSAYGKTECGYECIAAYGDIKCASTPWGACKAAYGTIACSSETQAVWNWPRPLAQATCKAAYGEIACGWSCVAAYGKVACASSPEGTCSAAFGEVTCFDGPRRARLNQGGVGRAQGPRQRGGVWALQDVVPATCKSAYGTTVCGYGCLAAYGQVKCAQTPQGTCKAAYGEVTCWDPGP